MVLKQTCFSPIPMYVDIITMAIEDSDNNLKLVKEYVQKTTTGFTLEDAVTKTGLPVIETKVAVDDLMNTYNAKLRVTENGDLIYDFGSKLERRDKKPFSESVKDFMAVLWKGFQVFYKLLTAAFLIIYFVIFLVLIIGLALSGGNNERNDRSGNFIGGLLRAFWTIFQWNTILGYDRRYYRQDRHGYNYQRYQEQPRIFGREKPKDPKDDKSFVSSIYDFIFGPPRVELDPLANSQEVASFLKEYKGLITTSEVQALAGWRREEAENFMTKCLGYFDGEAKISDNATLYGDFSQLLRNKDKTKGAPIIWYWDEYEPEHELTGNSTSRNTIIVGMNLFNLVISSMVLSGTFSEVISGWPVMIGLGIFPLIYSFTFFLIPFLRWIGLRKKQQQQHRENIRKRLMKVVFQTHSKEISAIQLAGVANDWRTTEEKLDAKVVAEVMRDTIQDLGGEGYVNDKGETVYRFELLGQELDDIDEIRKGKRPDTELGDVIFEA